MSITTNQEQTDEKEVQPPENYIFETVEDYYIIEDMSSPEWDYYAEEYWNG